MISRKDIEQAPKSVDLMQMEVYDNDYYRYPHHGIFIMMDQDRALRISLPSPEQSSQADRQITRHRHQANNTPRPSRLGDYEDASETVSHPLSADYKSSCHCAELCSPARHQNEDGTSPSDDEANENVARFVAAHIVPVSRRSRQLPCQHVVSFVPISS